MTHSGQSDVAEIGEPLLGLGSRIFQRLSKCVLDLARTGIAKKLQDDFLFEIAGDKLPLEFGPPGLAFQRPGDGRIRDVRPESLCAQADSRNDVPPSLDATSSGTRVRRCPEPEDGSGEKDSKQEFHGGTSVLP
jgi:hypothetical protein